MSDKKIPEIIYIPKITYSNEFTDVLVYQYELHWSTKKGTYKDELGKNCTVSLEEAIFSNKFSKLVLTIFKLANLFSHPMAYIYFWHQKLNVVNDFSRYFFKNENYKSSDFTWFLSKVGSASSVFLNEITILLESVFLFTNTNLFNNSVSKNSLLINSYSIIEAFIISVNAIYVSINKTGKELTDFDQRLNKINIIKEFEKSEIWEKEFSENFKNNFKELAKIRNIIVHPFSYKEGKNNYSYWQIKYTDSYLKADEIELIKMNETNIKNKEWIKDIMEFDPFEYQKYNILDLLNSLLEELLNYFQKRWN